MRANSHVQRVWLRLLGTFRSRPAPRIAKIQEGYYAVLCDATGGHDDRTTGEDRDFCAVKNLIPHLDRTRAVYLSQQEAYGLNTAPLREWARPLGKPVEEGACHAFAIIDQKIFGQKVCATLRTAGWAVKPVQDNLRVRNGRFTECANLLRVMVQMVLSRGTFAEAAGSLKNDLANRFSRDARLFARFEKRFPHHHPAILGRYFTVSPNGSGVAAGWDYWQASQHTVHEAAEVFEQAMKDFETLLDTPPRDWIPGLAAGCCEQGIIR